MALTGLTTVPVGATYRVTGHDSPGDSRWKQARVVITADDSLDLVSPDAVGALERAVQTWQAALEYGPTLDVVRGRADSLGYTSAAENHNTVRFAPYGEPQAKGALAITILACDDQGEIIDADIVLNGIYSFEDQADGDREHEHASVPTFYGAGHDLVPSWDLQGILTHEMGHFLGLGENHVDVDATMYAYALPGDTAKRDLATADLDALETAYPATASAEPEPALGCAGASLTGHAGSRGAWLPLFGALSLLVLAARRAFARGEETAELGQS